MAFYFYFLASTYRDFFWHFFHSKKVGQPLNGLINLSQIFCVIENLHAPSTFWLVLSVYRVGLSLKRENFLVLNFSQNAILRLLVQIYERSSILVRYSETDCTKISYCLFIKILICFRTI